MKGLNAVNRARVRSKSGLATVNVRPVDALEVSPEEQVADAQLRPRNGVMPSTMDPQSAAELKAHAFYLVCRLGAVDPDVAVRRLSEGFQITPKRTRELVAHWKQETRLIADQADRRWLRDEMVATYEASRARSMMLDAFAMELPAPDVLAESRRENQFQLQLAERIVEVGEQIVEMGDEEEVRERTPAAIDTLVEAAQRLHGKQSVEVTYKVSNNE